MTTTRGKQEPHLVSDLRIIWAITAKDLVDGLRNKQAVAVVLSALFTILLYRYLPSITRRGEAYRVFLHDEGDAAIVAVLENSPDLRVYAFPSEARIQDALAEDGEPEMLGLVVPGDYDDLVATGGTPSLVAYAMAWTSDDQVRTMFETIDGEIAAATGVSVEFEERRVELKADGLGGAVMPALSIVFIALMNGMLVPAHLMLEEKRTKTLSVLLVSPATAAQVVIGKALTGLAYVATGVAVAAGLNHVLINHWTLVLLGLLGAAAFCVGLGLLVGTIVGSVQQMTLWSWIFLVPLMIPIFLTLMPELIPAAAIRVMRLLPTVALFDVFRMSMVGQVTATNWLPRLGLALVWATLVVGVTVWAVRRMQR